MLKNSIKLFAGFYLLLVSTSTLANTPEDRLQEKLNHMKSMTASFKQIVRAEGREVSRSRGKMALLRPGRFRWHTISPMEQLVVADGSKLWVYDIELEQVTVKRQQKGIGGTPGLFLSGYDDTVSRDFHVVESKMRHNQTQYDMNAKSKDENYQRVLMTFNQDKLVQLVLYDQLGQKTTVDLASIRTNPTVPMSQFKFKPPKGVDVVKQ
ncbi:outer membrane lipoprotein chaperone LolA [Legionella sp. W05-934-2]|jgi:outer membrane lipoprotein carrier protein|uniref:outer membrane lipoprotein chaperone LolA n=1 Tax=Legionella sp. W05-934-2 TaxID=1198649 RepID=UPI003461BFCB